MRVFGLGKKKMQQDTIALTCSLLEPIYTKHFGRSQPPNLARVIVEQSFKWEVPAFQGRAVGGRLSAPSHAAEALTAAYTFLDLPEEAQAACAEALCNLVRHALAPANEPSLSDYDHHYLTHLSRTLAGDRRWREMVSLVPGGQAKAIFTPA